jgi:hypothetical protein
MMILHLILSLRSKCTERHLRAYVMFKKFSGVIPQNKRGGEGGKEGRGGEGMIIRHRKFLDPRLCVELV